MRRRIVSIVTLILMSAGANADSRENPFAFFEPSIQLSDRDQRQLDQRGIVLKTLPADGRELATFSAGSITVDADSFISAVRNIADLKRGALVPQIGVFAAEPQLDDLRQLTLDAVDVDELRKCRPERCGVKLTPQEIVALQHASAKDRQDAHDMLDAEFRRIVLERVRIYHHRGDQDGPEQFATLVQHSPYMTSRMPQLVAYLTRYPTVALPGAESFLYWSKETYAWKPMITVTHVVILRGDGAPGSPEVLAASRDIFSTRYTSSSLTLTMLFRDREASKRYLVYVNRTWVDSLRALWRPLVERRVRTQGKKVFADVRDRIERNALAGALRGRAP
jgi:hypothetical protein